MFLINEQFSCISLILSRFLGSVVKWEFQQEVWSGGTYMLYNKRRISRSPSELDVLWLISASLASRTMVSQTYSFTMHVVYSIAHYTKHYKKHFVTTIIIIVLYWILCSNTSNFCFAHRSQPITMYDKWDMHDNVSYGKSQLYKWLKDCNIPSSCC